MVEPRPSPISAAAYLQDAAKALTACGSATALYGGYRNAPPDVRHAIQDWVVNEFGVDSQARFARTSILFSALAAEAYVNAFLDERLSGADVSAIDRLPAVDKYVIGVSQADATVRFPRGAEPTQTLKRLFDTRNKLVHPKPRGRSQSLFTPKAASEFLVAAAKAARLLTQGTKPAAEFHIDLVVDNASVFTDWGSRWTGALPALLEPEPPGLLTQLLDEVTEQVVRETSVELAKIRGESNGRDTPPEAGGSA